MNDTPAAFPDSASGSDGAGGRHSGELWFQRCAWCDSAQLRPGTFCRICAGEDLVWEISSGLGTVSLSRTVTRRMLPPAASVVQLDEGCLIEAWVVGEPSDELRRGSRVRFSLNSDAASALPVFELTGTA